MKKKRKLKDYTIEIDGGWWYYKAENMTNAIIKAIKRSKKGIDNNFEVLKIRGEKGKHEHGPAGR